MTTKKNNNCTVTRNRFDIGGWRCFFFTKWLNYNQWWSYKNVCSVINTKKKKLFFSGLFCNFHEKAKTSSMFLSLTVSTNYDGSSSAFVSSQYRTTHPLLTFS